MRDEYWYLKIYTNTNTIKKVNYGIVSFNLEISIFIWTEPTPFLNDHSGHVN